MGGHLTCASLCRTFLSWLVGHLIGGLGLGGLLASQSIFMDIVIDIVIVMDIGIVMNIVIVMDNVLAGR